MHVQRCLIDLRDARGDPKEDRPFLLGERSTEQRDYRHGGTTQRLLELHRAQATGIQSVATTNQFAHF